LAWLQIKLILLKDKHNNQINFPMQIQPPRSEYESRWTRIKKMTPLASLVYVHNLRARAGLVGQVSV